MSVPALLDPSELDDPAKFTPLRVPVFKPHSRTFTGKDGQPIEMKVSVQDLEVIANNINKATSGGHLARLTIGHPSQHPLHPEHQQTARLVGFSKGATVALYKGEPHLFLTLYAKKGEEQAFNAYPFRSVDYDTQEKRITGVALLLRDPFLDLGAVSYSADRQTVPYSLGVNDMNEELTEVEKMQFAKLCAYMKSQFPKLASYMDDPGSTNTSVDVGPTTLTTNPMPTETMKTAYQAEPKATPEYSILEKQYELLLVEKELDTLAYQGVRFDRGVEVAKLLPLDAAKRAEHIGYMKTTYQKIPLTTGFLPVAAGEGGAMPQAKPTKDEFQADPKQAQAILAYHRAQGGSEADFPVNRLKWIAENVK